MKDLFKIGDKKWYTRRVTSEDLAVFNGQLVHPVLATFALARDFEWTTRQFVLQMREEDEEGVGTFLSIDHRSPAFEGEEVSYAGIVERINGTELICGVEARVGTRIIATGKTGQKIFKRDKLKALFERS